MADMRRRLECPNGCGVIAESNDDGAAAAHTCRKTAAWTQLVPQHRKTTKRATAR
jgi:hypothetical protein